MLGVLCGMPWQCTVLRLVRRTLLRCGLEMQHSCSLRGGLAVQGSAAGRAVPAAGVQVPGPPGACLLLVGLVTASLQPRAALDSCHAARCRVQLLTAYAGVQTYEPAKGSSKYSRHWQLASDFLDSDEPQVHKWRAVYTFMP